MTRATARTPIYSSSLIRFLADLALVDKHETAHAFAEKLGDWLDFRNAIALHGVLGAPVSTPARQTTARVPTLPASAAEDMAKSRAALNQSIIDSFSARRTRARTRLPEPSFDPSLKPSAAYEPYRRYYLALQRDLETGVRPLRSRMRRVLAQASPELRRLAALDEALESILAERESKLLAKIPALLETRFKRLLKEHQKTLADAQLNDSQAYWAASDSWLAQFCQELQMALQAELDIRLLPTQGMLEALNKKTT